MAMVLEMAGVLEGAITQCSTSLRAAREEFPEITPTNAIQTRKKTDPDLVKLIKLYLDPKEKTRERHDLRIAKVFDNQRKKWMFVKERRVIVANYEYIDRGSASDAYMHLRLWLFETENGRKENPAVPNIYNAYSYWNNNNEWWVGIAQEELAANCSFFAKIDNALQYGNAGVAETVAAECLEKILPVLARFQDEFWLVHNDIHLRNVYLRENHTPVLIDFDRASYYLTSTRNEFLAHTHFWYQNSSIWARDVQQLVADILHELSTSRRLDTFDRRNPFLNKLKDILSFNDHEEVNRFTHYLDFAVRTCTKIEDKKNFEWFLKFPQVSMRDIAPPTVAFGVVGEFFSALEIRNAIGDKVAIDDALDIAQKCAQTGPATQWGALEYVSKTLPENGKSADMIEMQWMPGMPAVHARVQDAWHFTRVKEFIEFWAYYNFALLWLEPKAWFSMHQCAVPEKRRAVYFTVTMENLQRVMSLFYEAMAHFYNNNEFILLSACHVALFGQLPFCMFEAFDRMIRDESGKIREFCATVSRDVVTRFAYETLMEHSDPKISNDKKKWRAQCVQVFELAKAVRMRCIPNADVARQKLTAVGSVRWLFGDQEYAQIVRDASTGEPKAIQMLTHVCLACVHPEIIHAKELHVSQLEKKMKHSERAYVLKNKMFDNYNNVSAHVNGASLFGAPL